MQIKIKGEVVYTYSVKRLVYTLCFFLFCVIDQRSKTTIGRWVYRDLTGVVMMVVIMSHYHFSDFVKWKIPYLIWTAICIICTPIALFNRIITIRLDDWLAIILNVILYGYIVIHTFISIVMEKKYPKLNVKFGAIWLVMMLLMILQRTYVWPFCYLVMFGCFYLTDYSKEEQEALFQGMLDGIILGFFILQGLCFVFRPYDMVRYRGLFSSSNSNSLFYVEVLAAVFAKILYITKSNANKWMKVYYWVGAGTVLSFELLTIGRTGWLTAIFLIFAFIKFLSNFQGFKRWWKNLLTLLLCVCVTFPLCFSAIRYIPPLFHHPVWFEGEWNTKRVHSWDAWDSPKYIDIDEFFDAALERVFSGLDSLLKHSPFLLKVDAAEEIPENKIPVLEVLPSGSGDSFLERGTIYKYYFKHLKLWGQPYAEQGFQLTSNFWVWHAHNIFLQYGTDFGIPVMILFIITIIWGAALLGRRFSRYGMVEDAGNWMFLLIPAVFGLLEYSWGTGSLSILLLFVACKRVVCSEE